jgi:hypothetical protein
MFLYLFFSFETFSGLKSFFLQTINAEIVHKLKKSFDLIYFFCFKNLFQVMFEVKNRPNVKNFFPEIKSFLNVQLFLSIDSRNLS